MKPPPDVVPSPSYDQGIRDEDPSGDEAGRLDTSLSGPVFDDIASLAARVLHTSSAYVTLIAADGRPALLGASGISRSPAGAAAAHAPCAVCEQVATSGVPVVMTDARSDARFANDPTLAEIGAVAYHCLPLLSEAGTVLGALCAADAAPREWSDHEAETLAALAAQAAREIELRKAAAASERLHATLRRHIARSDELFRLAPAFICIMRGADHVFEFVNDRFLELIGHRDVIGRPVGEIMPELAAQGFIALLDQVRSSGEAYVGTRMRFMVQRAPGIPPEERHISFVLQTTIEEDGTRGGVFALGVDVTEEVLTRHQLARRDALLVETQQIAHIGSWEYDVARGAVTWTDEMYHLHGIAPGAGPEALANYDDHLHPDDRELVRSAVARAAASGEPFAMDYRIVRPDGSVRSVHGRGRVESDASGRMVRLLGSCQDVTDRMDTLAALRDSEERYRLVQRATRDVIWEWDVTTGELTISDSDFAALGYTSPESPTFGWWQDRLHPDDSERVLDSLRAVLEGGGESWSCDYRFQHGNGGLAWLMSRAHILRDETGRAVRLIGASADRTEQYALAEQLREAQRMESVGRLAGGIAHDFNNLLTVISASALFARSEVDPAGQAARDLDQIDGASRRAADLTRQLLAFGRKQLLRPQRVDVNQSVEGMREMMRRIISTEVQVETLLTSDPRPARADPGQLDQVLLNLVINARDAMPGGGVIRITTANVEIDGDAARSPGALPPGCYVSTAVSDSGVGIAPSLLPHIFEPFMTTKAPGEGTGLGLAMVYGIIKQSGGHVDARSTPGLGTTMTVFLPCDATAAAPTVPGGDATTVAAPGAAAPDATTAATAVPTEPAPTAAGGRETILLVEDDGAVRASLRRVLAQNGYRVIEAANGEEALRVWHAHNGALGAAPAPASDVTSHIDVVLTDLVMPVLGGQLLMERLRAAEPECRIVIMSGYTADAAGVQEVLAGTDHSAFLQKPIRPDELLRTVRAVIDQRSTRRQR